MFATKTRRPTTWVGQAIFASSSPCHMTSERGELKFSDEKRMNKKKQNLSHKFSLRPDVLCKKRVYKSRLPLSRNNEARVPGS